MSIAEENQLNRRNFLKTATIAIVGFISAAMGLPAIVYIVGPAVSKKKEAEWLALGPVSKVEIGQPTLFKFTVQVKTGWIIDEHEVSVYVYTQDGRDYAALSNICTHLGCRVRWINDKEEFFCPCHNGVFDKQGNVVSGPPPRPLDRYEIKVEDDQIYVKGG
jgi:Rieske Fe-S protein